MPVFIVFYFLYKDGHETPLLVPKVAPSEFRCALQKEAAIEDVFFMQVVGRHFKEEMVIHAMKTIEELLKRKM